MLSTDSPYVLWEGKIFAFRWSKSSDQDADGEPLDDLECLRLSGLSGSMIVPSSLPLAGSHSGRPSDTDSIIAYGHITVPLSSACSSDESEANISVSVHVQVVVAPPRGISWPPRTLVGDIVGALDYRSLKQMLVEKSSRHHVLQDKGGVVCGDGTKSPASREVRAGPSDQLTMELKGTSDTAGPASTHDAPLAPLVVCETLFLDIAAGMEDKRMQISQGAAPTHLSRPITMTVVGYDREPPAVDFITAIRYIVPPRATVKAGACDQWGTGKLGFLMYPLHQIDGDASLHTAIDGKLPKDHLLINVNLSPPRPRVTGAHGHFPASRPQSHSKPDLTLCGKSVPTGIPSDKGQGPSAGGGPSAKHRHGHTPIPQTAVLVQTASHGGCPLMQMSRKTAPALQAQQTNDPQPGASEELMRLVVTSTAAGFGQHWLVTRRDVTADELKASLCQKIGLAASQISVVVKPANMVLEGCKGLRSCGIAHDSQLVIVPTLRAAARDDNRQAPNQSVSASAAPGPASSVDSQVRGQGVAEGAEQSRQHELHVNQIDSAPPSDRMLVFLAEELTAGDSLPDGRRRWADVHGGKRLAVPPRHQTCVICGWALNAFEANPGLRYEDATSEYLVISNCPCSVVLHLSCLRRLVENKRLEEVQAENRLGQEVNRAKASDAEQNNTTIDEILKEDSRYSAVPIPSQSCAAKMQCLFNCPGEQSVVQLCQSLYTPTNKNLLALECRELKLSDLIPDTLHHLAKTCEEIRHDLRARQETVQLNEEALAMAERADALRVFDIGDWNAETMVYSSVPAGLPGRQIVDRKVLIFPSTYASIESIECCHPGCSNPAVVFCCGEVHAKPPHMPVEEYDAIAAKPTYKTGHCVEHSGLADVPGNNSVLRFWLLPETNRATMWYCPSCRADAESFPHDDCCTDCGVNRDEESVYLACDTTGCSGTIMCSHEGVGRRKCDQCVRQDPQRRRGDEDPLWKDCIVCGEPLTGPDFVHFNTLAPGCQYNPEEGNNRYEGTQADRDTALESHSDFLSVVFVHLEKWLSHLRPGENRGLGPFCRSCNKHHAMCFWQYPPWPPQKTDFANGNELRKQQLAVSAYQPIQLFEHRLLSSGPRAGRDVIVAESEWPAYVADQRQREREDKKADKRRKAGQKRQKERSADATDNGCEVNSEADGRRRKAAPSDDDMELDAADEDDDNGSEAESQDESRASRGSRVNDGDKTCSHPLRLALCTGKHKTHEAAKKEKRKKRNDAQTRDAASDFSRARANDDAMADDHREGDGEQELEQLHDDDGEGQGSGVSGADNDGGDQPSRQARSGPPEGHVSGRPELVKRATRVMSSGFSSLMVEPESPFSHFQPFWTSEDLSNVMYFGVKKILLDDIPNRLQNLSREFSKLVDELAMCERIKDRQERERTRTGVDRKLQELGEQLARAIKRQTKSQAKEEGRVRIDELVGEVSLDDSTFTTDFELPKKELRPQDSLRSACVEELALLLDRFHRQQLPDDDPAAVSEKRELYGAQFATPRRNKAASDRDERDMRWLLEFILNEDEQARAKHDGWQSGTLSYIIWWLSSGRCIAAICFLDQALAQLIQEGEPASERANESTPSLAWRLISIVLDSATVDERSQQLPSLHETELRDIRKFRKVLLRCYQQTEALCYRCGKDIASHPEQSGEGVGIPRTKKCPLPSESFCDGIDKARLRHLVYKRIQDYRELKSLLELMPNIDLIRAALPLRAWADQKVPLLVYLQHTMFETWRCEPGATALGRGVKVCGKHVFDTFGGGDFQEADTNAYVNSIINLIKVANNKFEGLNQVYNESVSPLSAETLQRFAGMAWLVRSSSEQPTLDFAALAGGDVRIRTLLQSFARLCDARTRDLYFGILIAKISEARFGESGRKIFTESPVHPRSKRNLGNEDDCPTLTALAEFVNEAQQHVSKDLFGVSGEQHSTHAMRMRLMRIRDKMFTFSRIPILRFAPIGADAPGIRTGVDALDALKQLVRHDKLFRGILKLVFDSSAESYPPSRDVDAEKRRNGATANQKPFPMYRFSEDGLLMCLKRMLGLSEDLSFRFRFLDSDSCMEYWKILQQQDDKRPFMFGPIPGFIRDMTEPELLKCNENGVVQWDKPAPKNRGGRSDARAAAAGKKRARSQAHSSTGEREREVRQRSESERRYERRKQGGDLPYEVTFLFAKQMASAERVLYRAESSRLTAERMGFLLSYEPLTVHKGAWRGHQYVVKRKNAGSGRQQIVHSEAITTPAEVKELPESHFDDKALLLLETSCQTALNACLRVVGIGPVSVVDTDAAAPAAAAAGGAGEGAAGAGAAGAADDVDMVPVVEAAAENGSEQQDHVPEGEGGGQAMRD
ncbi:unnamed protein product [Vitrella brassicaformis CCMP3155]|uniref:Uncharacterized protein n=2 Tax=Vitrella brassicaformis TaxID=1169539 RepID=A0A0G4FK54_VITBC|nr:unnamed protein product [Vitrella brassicaformis CCMP3155]|eukprot:CEM13941.1 unnamed protein product [Vitrella brassicaformis CCMP3155]